MSPAYGPPEPALATAADRRKLAWDEEEGGYSTLPFVVRERIEWRSADDGLCELYVPSRDRWQLVQDHWVPVLEGLARGEALPEVHRRAARDMPHRPEHHIRFIVRKVTSRLIHWDMAEVVIPEVPEVFGGRYERLAELGRGGMGIVWRCRDLGDDGGREVALKHAWNWRGGFRGRERNVRGEAGLMAKADHPAIVGYIDGFEEDGRFHLVRELLAGPVLSAVPGSATQAGRERRRILDDVVGALIHLRDLGYLCLDIKASNYMFDGAGGPVKLIDLGVCKRMVDGRVKAKGVPGTRSYADPVWLRQDHADETAAVYGAGRILWRLATAQSPRPRAHYESYFEQHPLDVGALRQAGATETEVALYEAACSPRPEDRPTTLEAFLDGLAA